jgi:DNA-binding MarR family transcriptional regulator
VELVEGINQQFHSRPPGHGAEWPELELTMPQMRIICVLRQGAQRMGNIASGLGSSLSSATSMVDRLVDKGLVERRSDPEDRRVVQCRLTPRGAAEVERFWRFERESIEAMVQPLTLAQLKIVVHAIELLYQAGHQPSAGSAQAQAPAAPQGRRLPADKLKAGSSAADQVTG